MGHTWTGTWRMQPQRAWCYRLHLKYRSHSACSSTNGLWHWPGHAEYLEPRRDICRAVSTCVAAVRGIHCALDSMGAHGSPPKKEKKEEEKRSTSLTNESSAHPRSRPAAFRTFRRRSRSQHSASTSLGTALVLPGTTLVLHGQLVRPEYFHSTTWYCPTHSLHSEEGRSRVGAGAGAATA